MTYILTFVAFLLIIGAMSIGYIIQRKSVAGSCGGLGGIGIEKECNCPEPCDARKKREAKEEARRKKLAEWDDKRIM